MRRLVLFTAAAAMAGCAGLRPRQVTVDRETVAPGTSVSIKGTAFRLHPGALAVGDDLPARMKEAGFEFEFLGRVTVINVVPSIDTPVCERQTHILGETKNLPPGVDRVLLSRDLPTAQRRFAKAARLENVRYFSDYKGAKFGRATGLLIEGRELLARGVIVLDAQGIVRHVQFVPELTHLPDMEAAFAAAGRLAR